jgi:drug/metabolite transporter (DMT)-like permease
MERGGEGRGVRHREDLPDAAWIGSEAGRHAVRRLGARKIASTTAPVIFENRIAASLLACLCYGIAASYTRRFLGGVPSLVSATGSQLGATIFLLPFCLWYWPTQAPSTQAWLAVTALGVLCTGTAYILYFRLIANAGPSRALTVTFAIPVFAIAYGVILLGEGVTHWMLGCALVIVLGTSLSSGLWSLPFLKPRTAD